MSSKLEVVDVWMIPSTDLVIANFLNEPRFRAGFEQLPNFATSFVGKPIEQTMAEMDEAGIDYAIVQALRNEGQEIAPNSLVAEWVQRHPERFSGSCCVDPRDGRKAILELRRWVKEYGFRAVMLCPGLFSLPPNDKRWYPIYAEAEDLGIPVRVQLGEIVAFYPSWVCRPMYLDEVALHFPGLTIIGGHMGAPWIDEVISLATKYPNVYVDTAANTPTRFPKQLVEFMNSRRGLRKVMFGSDYPALVLKKHARRAMELPISPEARAAYLAGNARRVFRLERSSDAAADPAPY